MTAMQINHVVKGDKPFVLAGWQLESHIETGEQKLVRDGDDLYIDGRRVDIYQSENKSLIAVADFKKELEGKVVLTACHLDYLLEHTDLIPGSWKNGKTVFFWGTTYRSGSGRPSVRGLQFRDGVWGWNSIEVDDCVAGHRVAVLAS